MAKAPPGPFTKVSNTDLKAFLDAKKRQSRLLGAVERHLLTRPVGDRRQDILHPSEIIKATWCVRDAYYRLRAARAGEPIDPKRHGLRMENIFAEGHSIHHKWQGWFADMGVMYGKWKSPDGDETAWGQSSAFPGWAYREVPLHSAPFVMAGHSDGWIVGLGDDCMIEIKSVGSGTIRQAMPELLANNDNNIELAFRSIKRPFRDHLLQGQVYLHLAHLMAEAGELPRAAPDEIVFLYECKANQEYREFVVKYQPELVEDIFDAARDIAWGLDHDQPPLCNQDPRQGCKLCATWEEKH